LLEKLANKLTRKPKLVALIAVLMLIPSIIGYAATRINYDILSYLPQDLPSSKVEQLLEDPFQMAATSMLIVEGMPAGYTNRLIQDIQKVPGVSNAVWISNLVGIQVPVEMIPADFREMFFSGQATMMLIQYDHPGASDETMEAIQGVRNACNERCFLAGFSVVIKDTRDVMDGELPIFVGLAVLLALVAMSVTLESTVLPFVYLASIGMAVVYNFGSNVFLGQISYITKAIAAVLQLGVTMDYSIFLYHRYEEEREHYDDKRDAMAQAIIAAFRSLSGSSMTTIAGFLALCFMRLTLGRDIGIVMAKGVVLGVIGCVTTLPSLILALDGALERTRHRALLPRAEKAASRVAGSFALVLVLAAALVYPAWKGYRQTNANVYYELTETLPEDMDFAIANSKLQEQFGVGATHMLLLDARLADEDVRSMIREMEEVEGVTPKGNVYSDITISYGAKTLARNRNYGGMEVVVSGGGMMSSPYGGGSDDHYPQIRLSNDKFGMCNDYKIAKGREFSYLEIEKMSQVCILGSDTAEYLFSFADPIDKTISINGLPFRVVGVYQSKAAGLDLGTGEEAQWMAESIKRNYQLLLLPSTMTRYFNNNESISDYIVKVSDPDSITKVVTSLNGFLSNIINTNYGWYNVYNPNEYQSSQDEANALQQRFLGGIAAISLLVGGIGIMNIMLVTVT